jgi:putative flippase GtrA
VHSLLISNAMAAPDVSERPPRRSRLPAILFSRLFERRLPRFLTVGCFGLATDAIIFSALSAAGSPDALARTISLAAATTLTWRLNRRFTFAASGRRTHAEAIHYAAVALCVQGFNLCFFLALRSLLPALPALAALATCAVVVAGLSFAAQSLVTFRSRSARSQLPSVGGGR